MRERDRQKEHNKTQKNKQSVLGVLLWLSKRNIKSLRISLIRTVARLGKAKKIFLKFYFKIIILYFLLLLISKV